MFWKDSKHVYDGFFDLRQKDSKYIFENTETANSDYINEMNRYPTIFISFENAKRNRESIITTTKKTNSKRVGKI